MRNIKYFLFSLICLFNFSVVFAEGEVIVKNVTPVYDAESTIVVTENENSPSVVFNDKAQSVLFKVVLENTTNKDLPVDGIELSRPSEDFLLYKLDGLNSDDVIKANSTKELTISLETIKKEGWGRNFNDELVASISFDTSVLNPNTSDNIVIISLIIIGGVAGFVFLKKYKVARYGVIVIAFFSFAPCIKADFKFVLPVTIDASYESQNVMTTAGNIEKKCKISSENGQIYEDCWYEYEPLNFWEYNNIISNIYFENNLSEHLNYTHKFDVSEKQNGKVTAYLIENDAICYEFSTTEFDCYDLYLQSDGIIYANEDGRFYFYRMFNLESINNIEGFDTSKVTNMSNMFAYAGYNSSTLKLDLSNFDTSDVTDMSYMFMYAGSNSTIFELDISGFDTSNVTSMNNMFRETGTSSESFTLDVSGLNTGKVTDMHYMFIQIGYSSPNFTLDVSNFDTSNVTDMNGMFREAGYSSKIFTLDVSDFDTSNVTDMGCMFYQTGYSNPNFTLDVSNFDTSNVTDMNGMFGEAGYSSKIFTLDVSDFDTSNVTDMSYMFYQTGYSNPTFTLDVSGFNTDKVTNMNSMFGSAGYNSTSFTLDVSKWDTSNVTNMSYMFYRIGYSNPTFTLDVSNFDTSNVTDMEYMFYQTGYNSKVFTLDVSNFDTSNVTDMERMFKETGYNSKVFVTEFTISNNNLGWSIFTIFEGVATQPGSQITINYTIETESLVDEMMANKSSKSNVVKGELVD